MWPIAFPVRAEGALASMPPAGQPLRNSRDADAWEAWQSKSERTPGKSILIVPIARGFHSLGDILRILILALFASPHLLAFTNTFYEPL
jgi:hypothetical protein